MRRTDSAISEPRPFARDLCAPTQLLRFEVGTPDAGQRLDLFLGARLPFYSRTRVQRLVAAGRVRLWRGDEASERSVRCATALRAGHCVEVVLDAAFVEAGAQPPTPEEALELPVWFEDARLLAVEKSAGTSVHPSRRHRSRSLLERVHRRQRLLYGEGAPMPSLCHRLDRETSGIVLLAKDVAARADIGAQFEQRSVVKRYLAVVRGVPDAEHGVIDAAVGRAPDDPVPVRMSLLEGPEGRACRTRWRRLGDDGRHALLELHPDGGRQHQLRVHLAGLGHPIVGDKLYLGGEKLFVAALTRELEPAELELLGHERLALHCAGLSVRHPDDGRTLELRSPLPAELASLVAS